MKKTTILIFLFLLISLNYVYADEQNIKPGIQASSQTLSINIVYPKNDIYKVNSYVTMRFFITDNNFLLMNDTDVLCRLHVYDSYNNLTVNDLLVFEPTIGSFDYVLNSTILNETGRFPYSVYCRQIQDQVFTNLSGYLSNYFTVTTTGDHEAYSSWIILAIIILLPLIFAWLMLQWCFSLGEDHAVFKLFMTIFSLFSVFFSGWFGTMGLIRFFEWAEMQEAITTWIWVLGVVFFVVLSYFIIYLIIAMFKTAKEAKVQKLNY